MLTISLSATDDQEAVKLRFEHSLVSLSKWESVMKKPFFGRTPKTAEDMAFYVECMVLNEDPPENFMERFAQEDFVTIAEYINELQTATTFFDQSKNQPSREVITNEVIYHWLVQFNIPFQPVETWHLSRLMTLVKVAGVKQSKPVKKSKAQMAQEWSALNAQRRQQMGTSG